ncbi:MAG: hypothetical protein AAF729_13345, partial [Pseudomonadota bacterium]
MLGLFPRLMGKVGITLGAIRPIKLFRWHGGSKWWGLAWPVEPDKASLAAPHKRAQGDGIFWPGISKTSTRNPAPA